MDDLNEKLMVEMCEVLRPCANALELNGPAFYMLSQDVLKTGKAFADLTLAELGALVQQASIRYNTMCERLDAMRSTTNG